MNPYTTIIIIDDGIRQEVKEFREVSQQSPNVSEQINTGLIRIYLRKISMDPSLQKGHNSKTRP